MNLLARLAEPAFAKRAPVRLNARALGFVTFVLVALYFVGTLPLLLSLSAQGLPAAGQILLLIAPLPQLLAALGGLRMWDGDAKGKRLVVLSLAAGFVWNTAWSLLRLGEIGLSRLPIDLAVAAVLYALIATSEFRGSGRIRDDVLGMLKKLDALAEPHTADAPFTLDARYYGLLIAAFGLVATFAIFSVLGDSLRVGGPTSVVYLQIGASLPAVFAFYGGLRLFLGDPRGKRKVVFAIALGYLYLVNALLRMPAGPCGSGVCEAVKFMSLIYAIPVLTGAAYFLYWLVGAMRYDEDARRRGALLC